MSPTGLWTTIHKPQFQEFGRRHLGFSILTGSNQDPEERRVITPRSIVCLTLSGTIIYKMNTSNLQLRP